MLVHRLVHDALRASLAGLACHCVLSVFRFARVLVTPVLGLDLALDDLARALSKEETVSALVHAFAGRLVVDFLLGELFFACHGVL